MGDNFDIRKWNLERYLNENKESLSEGSLANYYNRSEDQIRLTAKKIDNMLQQLTTDEEKLDILVDLITDLVEEYASARVDNYRSERY
jgi:isocitrate dehydrogenase